MAEKQRGRRKECSTYLLGLVAHAIRDALLQTLKVLGNVTLLLKKHDELHVVMLKRTS